jgi:YesN/AraC family two-component response regulator
MLLRRTLTQAGLRVAGAAGNGEQGIDMVLRERPDIVLMDIKMPGMDGLEAARRILETYRVCIVIVTAYSTEEHLHQAQELGACGFILKPISGQTFVTQLQEAYFHFTEAQD